MNMAVYESAEAQKIGRTRHRMRKEEGVRNMLSPLALEQATKLAREAASGASAEEVKVTAIEAQKKRIEGQIVRKKNSYSRSNKAQKPDKSLVVMQTLKGLVHMMAHLQARFINCSVCDLIPGTDEYARLRPTRRIMRRRLAVEMM